MIMVLLLSLGLSKVQAQTIEHSVHCQSEAMKPNSSPFDTDDVIIGRLKSKGEDSNSDTLFFEHVVNKINLKYSVQLLVKQGKPFILYKLLNKEFWDKNKPLVIENPLHFLNEEDTSGQGFSFGGGSLGEATNHLNIILKCNNHKSKEI